MSLHDLCSLEDRGRLMYGTPLGPDELDSVVLADGSTHPGIRPSVPMTWDFEARRFVPHLITTPQVCAGKLAVLAVMRGVAQQHSELSPMERCHGWKITLKNNGQVDKIDIFATQALVSSMRGRRKPRTPWMYDLGEPTDPFVAVPEAPLEYRSPQPAKVSFANAYPVSSMWLPLDSIKIIKPLDQYACEEEWLRDLGYPT